MAEENENESPKKFDETVPGGRYINAKGVLVNAHGQPLDEDTGEVLSAPAPDSE